MLIEAGFGYRFEFMDQLEVGKRFRHCPPVVWRNATVAPAGIWGGSPCHRS